MTRMPVAARQRSNVSALQRIDVSIANRQRTRAVDSRMLRRIVQAVLSELLHVRQAELGICLVAAPEMTRLNETFLRHAGPTDVIAFNYSSHDSPFHGEIFVCVDETVIQARRFRVSWQSELVRCIVHAILHLLGFDDGLATARRAMKREENRLLRALSPHFPLSRLAARRGGRPPRQP